MVSSVRFHGRLVVPLLGLFACVRQNPAFGVEGSGGAGSGGASETTTGDSTSGTVAGFVDGTSGPIGTDNDGSTTYAESSEASTNDTETIVDTTGMVGCEIVILDVESDTFVSNDPTGCMGESCADWTFTGIGNYDIRTSGQFDSVMLLRFVPPEPLAEVMSARVDVHVMGPLPPGVGLFEVHVLDTTSAWVDGSTSGPIPGQPTFNDVQSGQESWTNGDGIPVDDFDALRNDWPTVPVTPGDDVDDVLEFPIQPEDAGPLEARLSSAAPVLVGITAFAGPGDAVTALTMDAGTAAELRLVVCG